MNMQNQMQNMLHAMNYAKPNAESDANLLANAKPVEYAMNMPNQMQTC